MKRFPARSSRSRPKPTAMERLDARFAASDDGDNTELIRLLRAAMFADVDELEASGAVRLPELNTSSCLPITASPSGLAAWTGCQGGAAAPPHH
jgi:hypothetical protein